MKDQELMEVLLSLVKSGAGFCHHGTVEASTPNVREAFKSAMNDMLCMQAELYDQMAARGWYKPEQAEQNKVSALKLKYSGQ